MNGSAPRAQGAEGGPMCRAMQARIVGIDAVMVFVATDDRIAAFRRHGLPVEWWRRLRLTAVNQRVAAVITDAGVAAETPFEAVPVLHWPDEPGGA